MIYVFKPEFFKQHLGNVSPEEIDFLVRITNQHIKENGKVVTGNVGDVNNPDLFSSKGCLGDTHTAILINIEPIKKECLKHEPENIVQTFHSRQGMGAYYTLNLKPKCKHCGVELVAEWKAK